MNKMGGELLGNKTKNGNIMKSIKIILMAIAMTLTTTLSASADKYSINRSDLPQTAQEFLTKHFPKSRVSMVKTDNHFLKPTDYDVKLVNGTKIEFDRKGNWTSVDCKSKGVPESLILKPIRNYISKNFPGTFVVSIDKKTTYFEVELNDGIELKFDRLGGFKSMKMDD